jgi:hypothetical protein
VQFTILAHENQLDYREFDVHERYFVGLFSKKNLELSFWNKNCHFLKKM